MQFTFHNNGGERQVNSVVSCVHEDHFQQHISTTETFFQSQTLSNGKLKTAHTADDHRSHTKYGKTNHSGERA